MSSQLSYNLKLLGASWIARRLRARCKHVVRDVVFHPEMTVRLDVYSPATDEHQPVLVFVHGGGWNRFNKELHAPMGVKLFPEGMVVVIPDHTLHPHAEYEQMGHEVAAAVSWTLDNIQEFGGDPERVVVSGQSSGAHLVGLVMMDPRFLQTYGHSKDDICGMIGISGGYDLVAQYAYEQSKDEGITDVMGTMLSITGGQEHLAAASPISYVRPDLPPTLLLHGDQDQTVPVSQSIGFHKALRDAGAQSDLKIYRGRGHSEILFSGLTDERPELVVDIAEFVHGCMPCSPRTCSQVSWEAMPSMRRGQW